ncbi:hypothetical protein CPC08DRAFT_770304 [Agrocybe pediades]|nr:hypothetical protein CPC08DRAFT_770304 [Agrocybe pediades]
MPIVSNGRSESVLSCVSAVSAEWVYDGVVVCEEHGVLFGGVTDEDTREERLDSLGYGQNGKQLLSQKREEGDEESIKIQNWGASFGGDTAKGKWKVKLVEGPPSRRANAIATACPSGNHPGCIGGGFFNEDGKAYFYNDVFRYSPDKDEWRNPLPFLALSFFRAKYTSNQAANSPLSIKTSSIITVISGASISRRILGTESTQRSANTRSGHRTAVWKPYISLFSGFYVPGITTRYLNGLWFFDTPEYKCTLVGFKDTAPRRSPRSIFSFPPCKHPVRVMLDDTWLLNISFPTEETPSTLSTTTSKSSGSSKAKASSSKSGGGVTEKWNLTHGKVTNVKDEVSVSVTGTIERAVDIDDHLSTMPLPRYNAMLTVLRNTLYIYGGIYERGSREYALDNFYALQLDKMELEKVVEDLAEELEDVSLAEEEAKVPDEDEQSDLRAKATAFMGVSKDTTRSAEDVQSTPLPGETLAMFYARSREYWPQKAVENSGNRGKQLPAYKLMLEEVEKILQEAGLDEEEMRKGAAGGPALPGSGTSRNR